MDAQASLNNDSTPRSFNRCISKYDSLYPEPNNTKFVNKSKEDEDALFQEALDKLDAAIKDLEEMIEDGRLWFKKNSVGPVKRQTRFSVEEPSYLVIETDEQQASSKNSNAKLLAYTSNDQSVVTNPRTHSNQQSSPQSFNSIGSRVPTNAKIPHPSLPPKTSSNINHPHSLENPTNADVTVQSDHANSRDHRYAHVEANHRERRAHNGAQIAQGKVALINGSPQISPGGNQSVDSGNSSGKHTNLDTSSDSDPTDPNNQKISQKNQSQLQAPAQIRGHNRPEATQTANDVKVNASVQSVSNSQTAPLTNGACLQANSNYVENSAKPVNIKSYQQVAATKPANPEIQYQTIDVMSPNVDLVKQLKENWYRPNLSRDEAIKLLKTAPFGSFVIRDSTSYKGGYGLALRIERLTDKIKKSCNEKTDMLAEHVRHYLIETVEMDGGTTGYLLKGSQEEKIFPSLDRMIYKHMIHHVSLPIKLNLKLYERFVKQPTMRRDDIANKTLTTRASNVNHSQLHRPARAQNAQVENCSTNVKIIG